MIEWYEGAPQQVDLGEHTSRARRLHERGQRHDALNALCAGLHDVHADEDTWRAALELLHALFLEAELSDEALTLAWYLDDSVLTNAVLPRVAAADRARTWSYQAALALGGERQSLYRRAAGEFEAAGLLVHAAIANERAGNTSAARTLWSRLAERLESETNHSYVAGLARFNVARTCLLEQEIQAAREATVAAVHRLEEAADQFESIGQRERAFDCYHVLMAIGELTGGFEHVLEGGVNAIRILRQDKLQHHALSLYQHTIRLARAASELGAAATLAREMTEYARAQGARRVAQYALSLQAELWQELGRSQEQRHAPAELSEAALHASLLAHAELGNTQAMTELYEHLEQASSDPAKQRQYRVALDRTRGTANQTAPLEDPGLGKHVPPPEIWFDDLVEWEEAGSASARLAGIILDPDGLEDRRTRRAAVLGRLVALTRDRTTRDESRALTLLAQHLAPVGPYAVLSALEALFERPEPEVRAAAVHAIGRHAYKRSLVTLERAALDPDAGVRHAAVEEIRRQRFEHAFDPLARLYGHSPHAPARLAALEALARLDLRESHELLMGVLEHGTAAEAAAAARALVTSRGTRFLETARELLPDASPRLRAALLDVARQRHELL